MKTQLVKMLQHVGDEYAKGEQYEIDTETASKWLSADLCEKVETIDDRFDELKKNFNEAVDAKVEKVMEKINKAMSVDFQAPAVHVDKTEKRNFHAFAKAAFMNDVNYIENEFGKDMTTTDGSSGAFTVPAEHAAGIMKMVAEKSFMLNRVNKKTMSSDTLFIDVLDQTDTTASAQGFSNMFGGIYWDWKEDNATIAAKDVKMKQIKLSAKKATGYVTFDNYLQADSNANVEAELMDLFAKSLAHLIDYVIINGNGVGKPLGFLNSTATKGVSRASDDIWTDVTNMIGDHLSTDDDAVWVCHNTVIPSLLRMSDAGDNAIWAANASVSGPVSLYGKPVFYTEKCPTLATKGDLSLVSPSQYIFGMRQEIQIGKSDQVKWFNDQTCMKAAIRVDGQPGLDGPIKLQDNTTTVSPFVTRNA